MNHDQGWAEVNRIKDEVLTGWDYVSAVIIVLCLLLFIFLPIAR